VLLDPARVAVASLLAAEPESPSAASARVA
jgi:hypothetical protein